MGSDGMINVFQPSMGERELELIREVFESHWLGQGEFVTRFRDGFAKELGADPSRFLTTSCATAALFLAAEIFHFGPGDEIIAPAISFVAVGSAVRSSGAKLVLCDVDSRTLNATRETIAACVTEKTKAVILNHYGGLPCDMGPIMEFCRSRGIYVVEDAACAPFARYNGRAAGTFGDMGIWSFDSMKVISTGDGGIIYLKNPDRHRQAREAVYLGLPARAMSGMDSSAGGAERWWEYDVVRFGRREIMNNLAGAIGIAQLEKLAGFLARRREIVSEYRKSLGGLPWLVLQPNPHDDFEDCPYFFWVQTDRRDGLAKYLLKHGIYTTFRYWPLNRLSLFGAGESQVPAAQKAAQETLNLPLHPSLSNCDVENIVDAVRSFGESTN
jgi:dTDP-4-amino-4,6-dideoxygalactose transaminase